MISAFLSCLIFGAISLGDVAGEHLTARAHFDAHNVRLGDPMTLMIDFVGSAEFKSLHPPALSREVDKKLWKIDDVSAKTETTEIARRLTYRVRPLKEGLQYFPSLTFSYRSVHDDSQVEVSTISLPVNVKPGVQVVLSGLEEREDNAVMPDGIIMTCAGEMREDMLFRWEKACRTPTAKAFQEFDFPEARLNEAACHIIEGNWAKAIRIYSLLEWRIGQTPTIERGLKAALARKNGTINAELPIWRTVFRPILRFAWIGRTICLVSFFLLTALFFFACSKIIRLFVCLAFIFVPIVSNAQRTDPFEEMDRMMQRAFSNMNSFMGISNEEPEMVDIKVSASIEMSKKSVQVGDAFSYIISVESPRDITLEQIQLHPINSYAMVVLGKVEKLTDGKSTNPSNVVRRLSVPVRYDVPLKDDVLFNVRGYARGRHVSSQGSRHHTISFTQPFSANTQRLPIEIKPLPTDNQPSNFSGAVASSFYLRQSVNRTKVETNDVVVVTYILEHDGFVPRNVISNVIERQGKRIIWQDHFIANGETQVPSVEIVYYNAKEKKYCTATSKPTSLMYVEKSQVGEDKNIAVNTTDKKVDSNLLTFHFSPSQKSAIIARVSRSEKITMHESCGEWIRVESSEHIGWVKKDDYEGK